LAYHTSLSAYLAHCLSRSRSPLFFNAPSTTEICTLSLHVALPISTLPATSRLRPGPSRPCAVGCAPRTPASVRRRRPRGRVPSPDRKSTRLNSSHVKISYAVFCLKKKKQKNKYKSQHA